LTDDPSTNKFVIPGGTVIGPAGFVSFTQAQFGFTLNGAGETLYSSSGQQPDPRRGAIRGAGQTGIPMGAAEAATIFMPSHNTQATNNSAIWIATSSSTN